MMSKGSERNYKVGPKNNWRRTVWNEVLRRTNGREKTEPILYLAGPQDLDRAIAVSKGVPPQNMIAIDRDDVNVRRVRDQKYPAIVGDMRSVLASWPESRPVCAVLFDFCCGLTQDAVEVYDVLERTPLRDAIVMVNLMRGRDAWSNTLRQQISGNDEEYFDMLMAVSTWGFGPMGPPSDCVLNNKHRAYTWLVCNAMDAWQSSAMPGLLPQIQATPGYEEGYEDAVGLMWSGNHFKSMNPHFYSYKSGALTFDSVVFDYPVGEMINRAMKRYGDDAIQAKEQYEEEVRRRRGLERSDLLARRIAATLAVRTTRMAL